ncbi:MAG: alpha/beta hydrolase [Chloroflexi bacterium]|nr:alpha/beta hydrolase [Chloroflexota bacterium]
MTITFDQLYARADSKAVESLKAFRQNNPLKHATIDGVDWSYITLGSGAKTIVFLHGMTGAYDIWWQQIDALKNRYRIISVTYPAVHNLEGLCRGVIGILQREHVEKFNVVGTSLGGYFTQYLVAEHHDLINRAVFANTFPPNDLIAKKNKRLGALLPFLPESMVMSTLRKSFSQSIYPTSGNSEILLAFLMEQSYGLMSKAQFIARYHCVIDKFAAPDLKSLIIPVLIIEADNDPLVEETLRTQLKATYPSAKVQTLHGVGHFSYVNDPQPYTRILEEFLSNEQ